MAALKDDGGQGQAGGPRGVHVLQPRDPGAEPARRPDEPDDLDEAFACYDLKQGGEDWDRKTVIVDDELRELFATVPEGVLLEVLLDTCHSGTGTEGPRRHPAGDAPRSSTAVPAAADPAGAQPCPLHPRAPDHAQVDRKALVELTKTKGRAPSRCCTPPAGPTRPPRTRRFDNRPNGAFTYLFLKALAADSDADPRASCTAPSPRASRARTSSSARRWRARRRRRRWRSASSGEPSPIAASSVAAHPSSHRLGPGAPLLAVQPAALRSAGRLGRHPGERRRRQRLAQPVGQPVPGGDPVAVLRTVLGGGDRDPVRAETARSLARAARRRAPSRWSGRG